MQHVAVQQAVSAARNTPNSPNRRTRGENKKCRKVYGMERRDQWCTQCRWKKACSRFAVVARPTRTPSPTASSSNDGGVANDNADVQMEEVAAANGLLAWSRAAAAGQQQQQQQKQQQTMLLQV
ncbi:uncharacterized protein Dvir_GJ23030 [Drosophila virilis]|uniref:Uncharacterized protein n=1 Tax=Drosophila virilis TaxID=7244 RepID=B4LVS6_DROVI|nr:uncharacterized protein Dvir_GJ23030 [Drosophila virilis]